MLEELSNERRKMSATANALLRDYAGLKWPSMNHKGRIGRLVRELGFGHRRVRAIYNNEPGVSLRADEMAAIAALRKEETDALRQSQENYRLLETRIAALEALYEHVDEAFGSEHMAALRASTRGQGEGSA